MKLDPWGHKDPYDLSTLDTRLLLKYLRAASNGLDQMVSFERAMGRQTSRYELEHKIGFDPMEYTSSLPARIITVAQIKAELAQRPHVLRRLEHAARRKARAIEHRGRSKSKDR